jgi:hypothetical protein
VTAVGNFDVSASDQRILQPDMCRPHDGTRIKINPSGVYVSSISSKNQPTANAQMTSEDGEAYLQTSRDYKRRRMSQGASCSGAHHTSDGVIFSSEHTARHILVKPQDHTSHHYEDLIYMPSDSFPIIRGNFSTTLH